MSLFNLRNLSLFSGAIATSLVLALPARAQMMHEAEIADNHTGAEMEDAMTITAVASGSDSFSTLVQALQAAELADTLAGEGPYTVFAPTDAAFSTLPDGALEYLLEPENQEILQQVLTYHVAAGELPSTDITGGGLSALSGGLAIAVTDAGIVVNNASVVNPNIEASNGIIHGINRVLIPESLKQQLASQLGVESIY